MFVRLSNDTTIQWLEVNNKHIIEDENGNYVSKGINIDINKEIKDAIFNHQHVNNEIFDILEKENIYIKDLTCGYYLKTTRHDIILPDGVLSLDENEYNHHHDYEIEFEVEDYDQGLQTFKKIIQPYHLEYKQNCLSKIKRMLETLKNE